MAALILELIDKRDNVEIVRDQIAAILVVELAHQATLSGATDLPRVFIERSNPWGAFIEGDPEAAPIINVWFDNASFDPSSSNVVERQTCEATFNIDCYGYGVSADDGDPSGGHSPGDLRAALEAQRAVRYARNILMAGAYTYLGLQGVVGKRFPQTISMMHPQIDNRAVQRIVAARFALQVRFNEFSPQVQGEALETLMVDVNRKETGELLIRAEYPNPTP
jgi:hypothetical protein